MTEKRFCFIYHDGVKYLTDNEKVLPDNIALDLLNELADENEYLESSLDFFKITVKKLKDKRKELSDENEQLKSEINMLKTTISRNEAYIKRLTHKGEWKRSCKNDTLH